MQRTMFKTTKYIHFHNNTDMPILVEGWVDKTYGLSTLHLFSFKTPILLDKK
uniref:Uncharacterized protein n=1 Tax=viral metagenome TaxID=1070528 RepID=A0A6C0HD44_9ZZZZ